MPKESFKASRIVIKDLPQDQKISDTEMKRIAGGMSFRPELLSREWLILNQRSSGVVFKEPSYLSGQKLIRNQ